MSIWSCELKSPVRNPVRFDEAVPRIPKVLHQTWFKKRVPRLFMRNIQKFWHMNDDLDIVVWDDAECDAFMAQHWGEEPIYAIYRGAQFGPLKTDIFRYCLIYKYGGYYCDISKGVLERWTDLHDTSTSGVVTYEKNHILIPFDDDPNLFDFPQNYFANWAFGFSPEHPFLMDLINDIVRAKDRFANVEFDYVKNAIVSFTGPGMFTKCLHRYISENKAPTISTLGIDFFGKGKMNLRGSRLRFLSRKSYKKVRNRQILILESSTEN